MRKWLAALSLVFCVISISGLAQEAPPANEATPAGVDAQIKRLGDADFDVREAASKALLAAGKNAGPALEKAAASSDAETARRARVLLARIFPALELTVVRADAAQPVKVGQPVEFQLRIKNVSKIAVVAVRCLDGSTDGSRYPRFACKDSSDPGPHPRGKRFCGDCNQLETNDLVTLQPGEELDPFGDYGHGEGGFGAELCKYTPRKAGKVTLTFVCNYSEANAREWDGPVERRGQRLSKQEAELFQRVPKLRLEAKVELDVK